VECLECLERRVHAKVAWVHGGVASSTVRVKVYPRYPRVRCVGFDRSTAGEQKARFSFLLHDLALVEDSQLIQCGLRQLSYPIVPSNGGCMLHRALSVRLSAVDDGASQPDGLWSKWG
jgi:hypothetical protein